MWVKNVQNVIITIYLARIILGAFPMSIWLAITLFAVSITILLWSAKLFTQAAESIGALLGLSSFVIGVVIVSVGTSLPELVASVVAVRGGNSEVVSGNLLGSSLSNLLFVMGLTALLSSKRIDLGSQYVYIDLNFLIGAAIITVTIMYDGTVSFWEASLGLLAYGLYLFYLLKSNEASEDTESLVPATISNGYLKPIAIMLITGMLIYFSASKTIESVANIAAYLEINKAIVSMTLLALGTTLPECVVSITAARQGKAHLAVGNVLGSCIFNALAIPGIASAFGSLAVPSELLSFSLPFYTGAIVFFYMITQDKKVSHFEGALLLLIYVMFIGKVSNLI
jgi:cation:H+ antiporter